MTIEASIYNVLKNTTGLGQRVYPIYADLADPAVALPLAVYTIVSQVRQSDLLGSDPLTRTIVGVDFYAKTLALCRSCIDSADSLMLASTAFECVLGTRYSDFDFESTLYRYSTEYIIWHN